MLGFVLGLIGGGVAAYMYHDNIRSYLGQSVPALRDRTAERLGDLGERAGSALDRARARIDTTVRTGQERLRATGTEHIPHESRGGTSSETERESTIRGSRPGTMGGSSSYTPGT